MLLKRINGYILAIGSGLVLLAGALLLALQWGNGCDFSLYGKNIKVNTGLILACAAGAGWLAPKVFRVMLKGIRKVRKVRKEYKKL
ncbi:MAG: hypothetical protein QGG42_16990 [Phycisphaerae bacterium]|jgi:hypothetical protein|nr:hypothetical protein [Phycisphaerae bacterium]